MNSTQYSKLQAILKIIITVILVAEISTLAEEIRITQIRIVEGMIQLSWSSNGESVQLEKSESLQRESWEIINSDIRNEEAWVGTSSSKAFFRLTVQPTGTEAIPFGCDLNESDCDGVSLPPWCVGVKSIQQWPEIDSTKTTSPLKFDFWQGPYSNKAGFDAVELINNWFQDGTASGLTQDAFRSFDSGHSSVRNFYPQLNFLEPVDSYESDCRNVFSDRVTFGVQSLSASNDQIGTGISVIDYYSQGELLYHYNKNEFHRIFGASPPIFTREFYRQFFESNFLIIAPAVKSFERNGDGFVDKFTWLSPYYLHSIGQSGSDRRLLRPIIFAAASIPQILRTRILRNGMQVPVLVWLMKHAYSGEIPLNEIHLPAHSLPQEADTPPPIPAEGETPLSAYRKAEPQSAPFLETLIQTAHNLKHIPPVTRIKQLIKPTITGGAYSIEPFMRTDPYTVQAALRPSETLKLKLDMSMSWTDKKNIKSFHIHHLRNPASEIDVRLDEQQIQDGIVEISIPWQAATQSELKRSDLMLFVNDGTYDALPAYISVRHLQISEKDTFKF